MDRTRSTELPLADLEALPSHTVDVTRNVRLGLWGAATLDLQPVGSLLWVAEWSLLGAASGAGMVEGHAGASAVLVGGPLLWAIHWEPHSGLCTGSPAVGSSGGLGPPLAGSVALVSWFVGWMCKAWLGLWCPCLGPWGSEPSQPLAQQVLA